MACSFPPRNDTLAFDLSLNEKYKAQGYPARPDYHTDAEGEAVWLQQYLLYRANGQTHEAAQAHVFADIDAIWNPQPTPPHPSPLAGALRIANGEYVDDTGVVLPVLCHFGEAFSAYVRRPADVRRQLEVIAAAGYHGVRFWDVLGFYDGAWRGKEVTPVGFVNQSGQPVGATPDYYGHLSAFLSDLRALKLVAHHSRGDLNTMPWASVLEHCRRVGQLQRELGASIVALNESCNEAWQNGVPESSRLIEMANALGGHSLQALSCPPDASEEPGPLAEYCQDPADVFYVHGFRQNRSLDRIRHIFTIAYESAPPKRLGWQGEPAGPGSGVTVGQENHPEALALMCAMSLMSRQAWVYMSSHGVFWNGPIESMPGFTEVAQVRRWMPQRVMQQGTRLCHGGTTWQGTRVLVANAAGTLRCDHAMHPDRTFTCLIYGEPGTWQIPVEKAFTGTLVHPVTGQQDAISGTPGQFLNLTFERGRVLIGRLT